MPKREIGSSKTNKKTAVGRNAASKYSLKLYITGVTPKSSRAVLNVKKICEEHLAGRYELEIIDIYQQPLVARAEQLIAAPTLIKKLPLPLKRFIGDMTDTDRIVEGLDLGKAEKSVGRKK